MGFSKKYIIKITKSKKNMGKVKMTKVLVEIVFDTDNKAEVENNFILY